jgi:membrane protein
MRGELHRARHTVTVRIGRALGALRVLLGRLYREAAEDRIDGEAAKVAYFFFLSLFPFILALFAFTGIFGGQAAFDGIMAYLRDVLPGTAANYLERFVREVTGRKRPGLLSISVLATLYSASTVFVSLIDGLNVVYDIRDDRGWWRRRLIAFGALFASFVLLIAGTATLLAVLLGGEIAATIEQWEEERRAAPDTSVPPPPAASRESCSEP